MDYKQALQKVASLCASSEQCWQDIEKKLQKWEVNNNDIHSIKEYLYKERFLDDERYARGYIRDKMNLNKWGRKKDRIYAGYERNSPIGLSGNIR